MTRRQISLQDIDEQGCIASEVHENVDTSTSPLLAAGDLDARWQEAEAVGDETAGASNPTPHQEVVDEIGKASGITYADEEELRVGGKEAERDQHRWELDPASAEDHRERVRYRPAEPADGVLYMNRRHHQQR